MNILSFLPRFRAAEKALAELETREAWTREQISAFQLFRLNQLWSDAILHTAHYRNLAKSRSLPGQFTSLEHFQATCPILDKNLVRTGQRDFLSEKAGSGKWYHSGGSTGKPASYFRSKEAHLEMLQRRYRGQKMWGIGIFDRWVFLWGHAESFSPGLKGAIARCKQPILDHLRSRLRISAYNLSSSSLRSYLGRIAKFKPAAIYAYSTAGYLLAKEAKATGFRCPSLKLIVLTAEPVFPHIVKECEEAFGVPTVTEYGSAETGVLAFEWPDRTLRIQEDIFFVETPKREDGRYDIVVTILNSNAFPLIRYAIGDVTDHPIELHNEGFASLRNIAGRHQDLIIGKSGEPLYASWFEDLLEHDDAIRCYQVHQTKSGDLLVSLETKRSDVLPDVRNIQRRFAERVGYGVTVSLVDKLPSTPAGKHRWITSELANEKTLQILN